MIFPPNFTWPRYVAVARVMLGAIALVATCWQAPAQALSLLGAVLGLYVVCAILIAVSGRLQTGMLGLAALFGDTVYFLVLRSFGTDRLLWLATVFLLFLLSEALVFYGPVEVGGIAAGCALLCAVLPSEQTHVLLRTAIVAGALATGFAIHKRRQGELIESLTGKLKAAETAAGKAREEERQRIASDFHDGPLQSFISLQMRLEILRKLLERDAQAGMEDLKELQALALSQIRDLRAFLHAMRPADVDGANPVAAARRAAEAFQKESGIPVTFMGTTAPVALPQQMTLEVLQLLREALHNIQKHSGATRVAVAVEKTDRAIEVSVDDNGRGFSFAGTYTLEEMELLRLGPASLKRRARSLNADLLLESRPGRGAGIKFRIPLP